MPSPKRLRKIAGLALVTAAAALLAAGCRATGTPGAAGAAASASPAASAAPASGCTPDFCAPKDWDTAPSSSPFPEIKSFTEPINVVLSARSTVSLAAIQKALGDWKTVHANTQVSVTGIHMMCISSENADVSGSSYVPMQEAWRLDGCLRGNELSVKGTEGHVRMWHQAVPGSASGAWLITASYETMCVVRDGRLQPVKSNKLYAAAHSKLSYHCVDGGPGSITTDYPDGYDDGATAFAAAIAAAAKAQGWHFSQRAVTVHRASHAGEGGVPFNDQADVLTVTK